MMPPAHDTQPGRCPPRAARGRQASWLAAAVCAILFIVVVFGMAARPTLGPRGGIGAIRAEDTRREAAASSVIGIDVGGPKKLDFIVVPGGGGQRNQSCSSLPPWVIQRLVRAAAVQAKQRSDFGASPMIVVLSRGTPHRPNTRRDLTGGFEITEAESASCYLTHYLHVDASTVLLEATSLDTIGNAYFARTQIMDAFADAATRRTITSQAHQQQGDPLLPTTALVLTSEFHMARTKRIFDYVFEQTEDEEEQQGRRGAGPRRRYLLRYEATADADMTEETLRVRREREAASLKSWETKVLPVWRQAERKGGGSRLAAIGRWIMTQHAAYRSAAAAHWREMEDSNATPVPPLPASLRDSY